MCKHIYYRRAQVLLDNIMSPVSPWTLRAPDQLVRHLRPSVGMVLGGKKISWRKTCVIDKMNL
jgi:hypothetical protein